MDDCNVVEKSIEELSKACDGLMWLSETDYPWYVAYWEDEGQIERSILIKQYGCDPKIPMTQTTLDSWFKNAITERDWHDEIERLQVKRYRYLYNWLKNNLQDIKVFLVGEVEIDVYVVGKLNSNTVVSLSTKIVET